MLAEQNAARLTAAERDQARAIVERTCAEQGVPLAVPAATCAEVAAILRTGTMPVTGAAAAARGE